MKRKLTIILVLLLCLPLLSACGKDEIPEGPAELWVVTELTEKYGMNDQAERMIKVFQETYPDVTVKLDILPTDKEERAVYLEKIRTQIMGGGGPDVYLMPTNNIVPDESSPYGEVKKITPLFRDVNLTMYNGLFYDISEYYDEDETLEKEELNTSVMDGGVMDGCRYVLPLRYNISVYLVDRELLEAKGLDVSIFEGGMDDLMRLGLERNDSDIAKAALPYAWECYFSEYNDYPSERVLLTAGEVAELLRDYQAVVAMQNTTDGLRVSSSMNYVYDGKFFTTEGYAIGNINLAGLMDCTATAKAAGETLEMYPELASDGTLKGIIEYYAAIGSGCEYPRLAYEFVRLFLSEEAQYETYHPASRFRTDYETACPGWPVRTAGSVEPRFHALQTRFEHLQKERPSSRRAKFLDGNMTMTDADIPALTWQVDEARFPVIMEYEDTLQYYITLLNDYENNNAPTDVDIDALAQAYIDDLQFYLYEG